LRGKRAAWDHTRLHAPNRPHRLTAARLVVWLLGAALVLVPPGGAVCWPLPSGWHLHIGWSDAAGRPTLGLVVYVHRGPGQVADPHRTGFSALVAPDTVNLSDLRPVAASALWLVPVLTLAWLCLSQDPWRRQPEPRPLRRPPKQRAAF